MAGSHPSNVLGDPGTILPTRRDQPAKCRVSGPMRESAPGADSKFRTEAQAPATGRGAARQRCGAQDDFSEPSKPSARSVESKRLKCCAATAADPLRVGGLRASVSRDHRRGNRRPVHLAAGDHLVGVVQIRALEIRGYRVLPNSLAKTIISWNRAEPFPPCTDFKKRIRISASLLHSVLRTFRFSRRSPLPNDCMWGHGPSAYRSMHWTIPLIG
jgi:hypothetical protein